MPRFENVLPNFETPQPVEQSILYKTAEEIVDPVLAQSSGKIPNWLKGKFTSEVHYQYSKGQEISKAFFYETPLHKKQTKYFEGFLP